MSNTEEISVEEYEQSEETGSFSQSILVNYKQLAQFKNIKFDLQKSHGFYNPQGIGKYFSRKNIIYYGMISKECPVKMTSTIGEMMLPIITNQDIREKLNKIDEKDRTKIGYLFISTVQIILKSTFDEGINSPIDLKLFDGRIAHFDDSVLGKLHTNLAYTTVKFDVNVRYGIPLVTRDLSKTIGFSYKFYNTKLMHENEYPFTITYKVNYALTNSSHSLNFAATEKINLDKLFGNIAQVELSPRPILENTLYSPLSEQIVTTRFQRIPEELHRRSFSLPRIQERPFIRDLPKDTLPPPLKVSTPFNNPQLSSAVVQLRNQVNRLTTSLNLEQSEDKK